MDKAALQKIAEAHLGVKLDFLTYGSNWVFEGINIVVKVASRDLSYATSVAQYAYDNRVPALTPKETFVSQGYYFYVYAKGYVAQSGEEVAPWLGGTLAKLHRLSVPKSLKLLDYRSITQQKIAMYKDGLKKFSLPVKDALNDAINKAYVLPNNAICHGDPHCKNIVKLRGEYMLIDWDIATYAPREYDLAVVKYSEFFGEPKTTFNTVAKHYGEYHTDKLEVLLEARAAISLIWFAHNVSRGFFSDNGELQRRIDFFMGNTSIVFRDDYTVHG